MIFKELDSFHFLRIDSKVFKHRTKNDRYEHFYCFIICKSANIFLSCFWKDLARYSVLITYLQLTFFPIFIYTRKNNSSIWLASNKLMASSWWMSRPQECLSIPCIPLIHLVIFNMAFFSLSFYGPYLITCFLLASLSLKSN